MAVKKTLIKAIPYIDDGKVVRWYVEMQYEQGTEGKADYYTSVKSATLNAVTTHPDGSTTNNYTAKAEADWSRADIENICPITRWDEIFASQYDSVITNPPKEPVPDNSYVIPSS